MSSAAMLSLALAAALIGRAGCRAASRAQAQDGRRAARRSTCRRRRRASSSRSRSKPPPPCRCPKSRRSSRPAAPAAAARPPRRAPSRRPGRTAEVRRAAGRAAAAGRRAAGPPTTLQTTPAAAEGEVERGDSRDVRRARAADLNRVDYRALNADARTQYDTAKRFISQAEDALPREESRVRQEPGRQGGVARGSARGR